MGRGVGEGLYSLVVGRGIADERVREREYGNRRCGKNISSLL